MWACPSVPKQRLAAEGWAPEAWVLSSLSFNSFPRHTRHGWGPLLHRSPPSPLHGFPLVSESQVGKGSRTRCLPAWRPGALWWSSRVTVASAMKVQGTDQDKCQPLYQGGIGQANFHIEECQSHCQGPANQKLDRQESWAPSFCSSVAPSTHHSIPRAPGRVDGQRESFFP